MLMWICFITIYIYFILHICYVFFIHNCSTYNISFRTCDVTYLYKHYIVHTLLFFRYVSASYTSLVSPKSEIFNNLPVATRMFLAAKSRWTSCKEKCTGWMVELERD